MLAIIIAIITKSSFIQLIYQVLGESYLEKQIWCGPSLDTAVVNSRSSVNPDS